MTHHERMVGFAAFLLALATSACSESVVLSTETDADGDSDGDADGGSDADGDGDADGGSDADGDVDSDAVCSYGDCRICSAPDYDLWASQTCERDGQWGICREGIEIPPEAPDGWYSPEDERYCIEQGWCCVDMWDLDEDGDTWESLGHCDGSAGCLPGPQEQVCVPGVCRYCDDPAYSRVGSQTCSLDGTAWGRCAETGAIPEECRAVEGWYSPSWEQCCIENGYCCQDLWDLDGDGDTWESMGACELDGCLVEP